MLWYCGTWVWTGFEPRERPVRPASVKGLTSSSIVPHAPIDNLPFSVFNDARILTSGVYGSMGPRAKQLTLLLPVCTRCRGAIFVSLPSRAPCSPAVFPGAWGRFRSSGLVLRSFAMRWLAPIAIPVRY